MKIFILAIGFLIASVLSSIAFSFDDKQLDWSAAISASVEIDRPVSEVWTYVSDTKNAIQWSIYFHHISNLPNEFPDGAVGAIRRCYRNENEAGVFWDEKVLFIKSEKTRIIYSYNFNGYYAESKTYSAYVLQDYTYMGENKTRLTFKTQASAEMTAWDRIMFYFSKKQVAEIFEKNLKNIKNHIEQKPSEFAYTNKSYNFFEK